MARGVIAGGPARARCNMCGFLSEQRRLSTCLSADRPTGFCCGCATHRLHAEGDRDSLICKAMGQRLEVRGVLIPLRATGLPAGPQGSSARGDPGEGLVGFAAARTRANRSTCPRTGLALKRRSPRWAALRVGPRTASPRSARVGAAVHQGRRRGVRVRRAPAPGAESRAKARGGTRSGCVCSRGGGVAGSGNGFGRRPLTPLSFRASSRGAPSRTRSPSPPARALRYNGCVPSPASP